MRWVEGTDLRETIDRGALEPCSCRPPRLPGRERPRCRPRARPDPSRRQARQHPDHRPGPRLPDRLRAHEARQLDQRADENGPVGGHRGLHGAGADRRSDREPADRRVLAWLRPLRGPDGPDPVQTGERPGNAVGSRVYAAAVGARGLAGHTGAVRRRRAAGDGQGPRGALRVRRRARPRGARRGGHEARGSRSASRSAPLLRRAIRPASQPPEPRAPWASRPATRVRARRAAAPDRGRPGDRVCSPDQTSQRPTAPRRRPRLPCGRPPPGAACPPMPTARQNMASTVLDGTIWVVGGLESASTGSRRVEGYDPVINGWKAGPDLPVRLHHEMAVTYKDELVVIGGWITEGIGPERRDLRPRVRPARRKVGRAALPQPAARGGRGRRGRRSDRGRRRPGRWPPGRHHRGVRRQALEHRGEHPDPA